MQVIFAKGYFFLWRYCRIKFFYIFAPSLTKRHTKGLTHGVIGNTSDFGSEESRFEPWWVNHESLQFYCGLFLWINFSFAKRPK